MPATTTDEATAHKRLAAAISHPLRLQILEVLHRRVASPRDIAQELGAKVADVAYHVSRLREVDAVELVRTEPTRGTVKHFYRATTRAFVTDEQMKALPMVVRREIVGDAVRDFWQRVREAGERGGFDRHDVHVSSTTLDLDEQGYEEITTLLRETVERATAIQGEVVERRANGESPAAGIRTEMIMLHFLRADQAAAGRPA